MIEIKHLLKVRFSKYPHANTNKVITFFALFLALILLVACNQKNDSSTTESTGSVNSTEVKDQGTSNFCWSYVTMGMLESMYKKKTGQSIALSPEALAFWRLKKRLMSMVERAQKENASPERLEEIFKYSWDEGAVFSEALEMIEKYGAVPEDVWRVKMKTQEDADLLKSGINKRLILAWNQHKKLVTSKILENEIMLGEIFKTAPPTPAEPFSFMGKTLTSASLVTELVGFVAQDYKGVLVFPGSNLSEVLQEVKGFIASGVDVPFGISMDSTHIRRDLGVFEKQPGGFETESFHAMLFTDFVNKGGDLSVLKQEKLDAEVSKSYAELDYFYVKNSWGTKLKSGRDLPMGGKWLFKKSYLDAMLNAPKKNTMAVVLPQAAISKLKLPLCKGIYLENTGSCYASK